ncbi:MAG: hypothetical protein ACQERJ_08050 [Bacillota bacterium]
MEQFKKGEYLNYPCVNGCGHHMRLKDKVDDLEIAKIILECPDCEQEKVYSDVELKGIVNARVY